MVQETSPRSSCILAIKYYVAVEIIYYWLAGYSESRRGNLFWPNTKHPEIFLTCHAMAPPFSLNFCHT